jgi:sugar phosphate permease
MVQSKRLLRLQWVPVVLCAMAIGVNYIDRATVAVANLDIRREFGLNATEIGALVSVWSLCFAFSQLPMGWLVDRVGPRPLLGFALLVWSGAQAAGGLVGSFGQLLWARGVLGIGEAPAYSTSARVVTNWFPIKKRGFPTGVYNMAGSLAPAIAPPLLTALMLGFGWRAMFLVMGIIGIAASLVWFLFYREPENSNLTQEERFEVRGDEAVPTSGVTLKQWGRLFTFKTQWAMIGGSFCHSYVLWMYQAWLPGYLEMQHHFSIAKTGFYAAIPYICGIFGSLLSGYLSDMAARRGTGLIASRKAPAIIGLIAVGICTVLAAQTDNSVLAIIYISATMFFVQTAAASIWMIPGAVAPRSYVASSASIQNFGGYIGASISPVATGLIVDKTGSFALALAIAAAVAFGGALSYLLGVTSAINPIALSGEAAAGTTASA